MGLDNATNITGTIWPALHEEVALIDHKKLKIVGISAEIADCQMRSSHVGEGPERSGGPWTREPKLFANLGSGRCPR